jgi:hypothetical protein
MLFKKGIGNSLGEKVSVSRINITGTDAALFDLLQNALMKNWKNMGLSGKKIDLLWKDDEEDLIGISNNDDLLVALDDMQCNTYTLFAVMKENENDGK